MAHVPGHQDPDFGTALATSNQAPPLAPSPQVIPVDTVPAPFQPSSLSPGRIDFLRATSRAMLRDGASPDEAIRWMEIESQKTANLAPPVVMPGEKPPEPVGMINGLGMKVLQGVTWGFGDEALGAIIGAVSGIGARAGIDQYREEMEQWSEENGLGLGFAAEMVGAIITGRAVVKGVGALLGRGASTVAAVAKPSAAKTIVGAAGVGAVEGGLAGAGFAEGNISERSTAALFGLGFGGLLGGAVGGLGRLAGAAKTGPAAAVIEAVPNPVIQKVLQRTAGVASPNQNALEVLTRQVLQDGVDVATLRKGAQDMARAGAPATIADVAGEGTMALIANSVAHRTPAKQALLEGLRTRQADQGGRLAGSLISRLFHGNTFGIGNAYQAVRHLDAERIAISTPLYEQANKVAVTLTTRMRQLLVRPRFRAAWDAAVEVAEEVDIAAEAAQGLPVARLPLMADGLGDVIAMRILPETLPVRGFDLMKKSLDEGIQAAQEAARRGTGKPLSNETAKALRKQLEAVLSEVDSQVPSYRRARVAWAGPSQAIDAVEAGRKAGTGRTLAPELIKAELKKLSPLDADYYRLGYTQSLYEKTISSGKAASSLFGGRLFGSTEPLEAQAIRALFPNAPDVADDFMRRVAAEARITETTLRTNAPARATAQALESGVEGAVLPAVRSTGGVMVAAAMRQSIVRSGKGFTEATADELAILASQGLDDPADLSRLLDLIADTQERLIKDGRVGSTAAAITGFLAGRTSGGIDASIAN